MGKVADFSVFTPGGQPGAPNPSEGLAALRQNQTAFMETIGVMPPESLTVVDGAISPTTAVCIVDAEGGAPADDLTIINATLSDGGTLHNGMVILLSAKDASRVVTVKNSDVPNGVKTVDGKDIALSPEWSLVLQYVSGVWQQINVSVPLKPATGTVLGGVKPQGGDGALNVDAQGNLKVEKAAKNQRGSVLASEIAQPDTVPQAGESGILDPSWLPKTIFNTVETITVSGKYTPKVSGWHRVTVIGGGGKGGQGVCSEYRSTKGSGGGKGGDSTFDSITATGGSGGGGGGYVSAGGGGGAGKVKIGYLLLTKGVQVNVTVGAGATVTSMTGDGQGDDGGKPGVNTDHGASGGQGAKGAGTGQGVGWGDYTPGSGGDGGSNGTGYGGGGGGGAGSSNQRANITAQGGNGGDNGEAGQQIVAVVSGTVKAEGGNGGDGAVIVEYYDSSK